VPWLLSSTADRKISIVLVYMNSGR